MGGRGSGSGANGGGGGGSKDGTILDGAPRTIVTTYDSRGGYRDTVLEAWTDEKGNVTFSYATASKYEHIQNSSKYKREVTYEVQAGAVNGQMFNVNLSKAKSVSGLTYDLKGDIKSAGFKWNSTKKRWEK